MPTPGNGPPLSRRPGGTHHQPTLFATPGGRRPRPDGKIPSQESRPTAGGTSPPSFTSLPGGRWTLDPRLVKHVHRSYPRCQPPSDIDVHKIPPPDPPGPGGWVTRRCTPGAVLGSTTRYPGRRGHRAVVQVGGASLRGGWGLCGGLGARRTSLRSGRAYSRTAPPRRHSA